MTAGDSRTIVLSVRGRTSRGYPPGGSSGWISFKLLRTTWSSAQVTPLASLARWVGGPHTVDPVHRGSSRKPRRSRRPTARRACALPSLRQGSGWHHGSRLRGL